MSPDDESGTAEGATGRASDGDRRTDGGVGNTSTGSLAAHSPGVEDADRVGWWRQVCIIAGQEYQLSVRNRWAFVLTGLFALLSVLVTVFGGSSLGPARVDAIVVSLTQLATYLVPLAALVYGFDTVVGAEEAGWLDVVFALPVPRSRFVSGAYLGRAITLSSAALVGFGSAGAVLMVGSGLAGAPLFTVFLLGAVGVGLAFLALSVLVSTLAAEKTHALGGVLLVWVWFVFVHDLVALGAVASLNLSNAVLSAFILANPADVFRVLVLQQAGTVGGGLGAAFAGTGLSAPVLVAALLAWCLVPLAIAGRFVRRRSV